MGEEPRVADELVAGLYDELRRLAGGFMRFESPGQTLGATALVHEAYLRLAVQERVEAGDKNHFLALAARFFRRVLVDHARARDRKKRGGGHVAITLQESLVVDETSPVDVLALHEGLEALAAVYPRAARVAELKFFAGLPNHDIAEVQGVSTRTVNEDWRFGLAFLRRALVG